MSVNARKKNDGVHVCVPACVCWGGEFVNPCVCWCVICVCVCVCVAEQPAWRVSGILGSKRESKGERKERKDAPPVEL